MLLVIFYLIQIYARINIFQSIKLLYLSLISRKSVVNARTAMISLATVMSN